MSAFGYDPNCNLTSDGTRGYVYDVENRLVSATSEGVTATLVYDPLGRLFQISRGAMTTRFLHDGDELVAEYNASGTLLRRYVHGDDDDDPLFWYEGSGLTQPRFPHADRQGSIVAVAGASGAIHAINNYDEYGIPGAGNSGRFQYTGQAWLPELGLYYYKARLYSPTLGRFLQTDPIGYSDQINLYAYVTNDSINYVDRTGEQTTSVQPLPGCAACHSTSTPSRLPQAPRFPTEPSRGNGERTWYQKLGTLICQNSIICSAVAYEDPPFVEPDGKVHGGRTLPNPEDIHPDDIDDAIDALDTSIETRSRENDSFPDGKKNGTPEERADFQSKQQHRERQAEEQRLRDRLAKIRDNR